MKLVLLSCLAPPLDPCGPIHKYLYLVRSGGACSERDMNNVEASKSRGKTYQLTPPLPCLPLPFHRLSFSRKAFLVNFRFYVAARCAIL